MALKMETNVTVEATLTFMESLMASQLATMLVIYLVLGTNPKSVVGKQLSAFIQKVRHLGFENGAKLCYLLLFMALGP